MRWWVRRGRGDGALFKSAGGWTTSILRQGALARRRERCATHDDPQPHSHALPTSSRVKKGHSVCYQPDTGTATGIYCTVKLHSCSWLEHPLARRQCRQQQQQPTLRPTARSAAMNPFAEAHSSQAASSSFSGSMGEASVPLTPMQPPGGAMPQPQSTVPVAPLALGSVRESLRQDPCARCTDPAFPCALQSARHARVPLVRIWRRVCLHLRAGDHFFSAWCAAFARCAPVRADARDGALGGTAR